MEQPALTQSAYQNFDSPSVISFSEYNSCNQSRSPHLLEQMVKRKPVQEETKQLYDLLDLQNLNLSQLELPSRSTRTNVELKRRGTISSRVNKLQLDLQRKLKKGNSRQEPAGNTLHGITHANNDYLSNQSQKLSQKNNTCSMDYFLNQAFHKQNRQTETKRGQIGSSVKKSPTPYLDNSLMQLESTARTANNETSARRNKTRNFIGNIESVQAYQPSYLSNNTNKKNQQQFNCSFTAKPYKVQSERRRSKIMDYLERRTRSVCQRPQITKETNQNPAYSADTSQKTLQQQFNQSIVDKVGLAPRLQAIRSQNEIQQLYRKIDNMELTDKVNQKINAQFNSGRDIICNKMRDANTNKAHYQKLSYYDSKNNGIIPKEFQQQDEYKRFCNSKYEQIRQGEVKNAFQVAQANQEILALESTPNDQVARGTRFKRSDEMEVMLAFLNQVELLKQLSEYTVQEAAQVITAAEYNQGQQLLSIGQKPRELLIIYGGTVLKTKKVNPQEYDPANEILTPKNCLGAECLDLQANNSQSEYNYFCHSHQVKCLVLHHLDYKQINKRFYKDEIYSIMLFFQRYNACKLWSQNKLETFASYITYKYYSESQQVHADNEKVDSVIFVRSGKLRVDKDITMDHTNYWPVGYQNWEVNTTKTKQKRTILSIKEGDYIGVKEMREDLYFPGSIVSDKNRTTLMIISKEDFNILFTAREIEQMILDSPVDFPDERKVKIKLYANEKFQAMRNTALMNATNTNRIPEYYRDFYMEAGTKKLIHWAHLFESKYYKKPIKNNYGSKLANQNPSPSHKGSLQLTKQGTSKSISDRKQDFQNQKSLCSNQTQVRNDSQSPQKGLVNREITIEREKLNQQAYKKAMKNKDDIKNEVAELVIDKITETL